MHTVLIVDDEPSILTALERTLHSREDIHCLLASSAEEGLQLLAQGEVSVVISDYLMPGMRGVEFLAKVKLIQPGAVRIMMTAYADISVAIDAINKCETFRFITKPWNTKEFFATLDEALMRYQLVQSLKSDDENLYLSLAQTVELKDPYTKGHCDRVARYSVNLAKAAGLNSGILLDIKHGSWLHDCGKIGVPESILNFPGKLSASDMDIVKQHPVWGAEVANLAHMSTIVVNIVLYHHEQYNGNGYPRGLQGEKIPVEARIVAIADVFDALYSERPYRKAFGFDKVIAIMDEMSAQFDPKLMSLFLEIVKQEEEAIGQQQGH